MVEIDVCCLTADVRCRWTKEQVRRREEELGGDGGGFRSGHCAVGRSSIPAAAFLPRLFRQSGRGNGQDTDHVASLTGSRDEYIMMERHGRRALPGSNRQRYLVRASCSGANSPAQRESGVNPGYQGARPTRLIQHSSCATRCKRVSIGVDVAVRSKDHIRIFCIIFCDHPGELQRAQLSAGTSSDKASGRTGKLPPCTIGGAEVGYPAQ
jgi:hypothetical protein